MDIELNKLWNLESQTSGVLVMQDDVFVSRLLGKNLLRELQLFENSVDEDNCYVEPKISVTHFSNTTSYLVH